MAFRTQVITTGYNGAPGYNTFYGVSNDPGEAADLTAAVEILWDGLESVLANGTVWSCDGIVEDFDLSTGQTTAVYSTGAVGGNGTWGTAKAPGGTALVLQWRTGVYVNGRELRGRSFISGIGDFGDSTGAVPSSIITDAGTAAGLYGASLITGVYSPTNADAATIQSTGVWNKFGLIRSRRD